MSDRYDFRLEQKDFDFNLVATPNAEKYPEWLGEQVAKLTTALMQHDERAILENLSPGALLRLADICKNELKRRGIE